MSANAQNRLDGLFRLFHGLTEAQVLWLARLLVLIEEYTVDDRRKVMPEIREGFKRAKVPLNEATMRNFAYHAVKRSRPDVAMAWYEEIDRAGNAAPLRMFLLRQRSWNSLKKRFGKDLTAKELRLLACHHLREARRMSDRWNGHLDAACEIFAYARDTRGVSKVLRHAIEQGNDRVAQQAAKQLGRTMSKAEHLKLGKALLRRQPTGRETFEYIQQHGLLVLARPFFANVLCEKNYVYAKEISTGFGLPFTLSDLERLFNSAEHPWARLEIAQSLAARSKKWRRRLPFAFAERRAKHLQDGEVTEAEACGQRCGKPLTAEEILDAVGRCRRDTRESCRAQMSYAHQLLATRIHETVNGPAKPVAPARSGGKGHRPIA